MPVPAYSDGHPWVIAIARRLEERGQTIGFAESCTGGLLSAIVTRVSGISRVYRGSFVTYSNEAKERLLGVPVSTIRVHGAVSIPTARRMAEGARSKLNATWGLSVTGVAGPSGGSSKKPVGTVCFALVGPGIELVATRHFPGSRREVQRRSARYALRILLDVLGFSREEAKALLPKEKTRKRR